MPNTLLFNALKNSPIETSAPLQRAFTQAVLLLAASFVIAALAQLKFPIPGTPVPVTGQTLGVLLIGLLLGSKRGAAATALYLLQGGIGLPFFAGGALGFAYMAGPTGGYLIGFVVAAAMVGWLAERSADRKIISCFPAVLAGHAVIFLLGTLWLSRFVGWDQAISAGVLPFLPGAVVKTLVLSAVLPSGWKLIQKLEA